MKYYYFFFFVVVLIPARSFAQQIMASASAGFCTNYTTQAAFSSSSLNQIYRKDTCGLAYLAFSEVLGQRFTPVGTPQPVTINVTGLPSCYVIDKAFVWCDASGSGVPINLSITNPNSVNQNFPMTLIGSGPDKCWGFTGSYSYRADVTTSITGNGNYVFSGFPVSALQGVGDDVDGMVLMIIYRDILATWEGHLLINDGVNVQLSTATTESLTPINACDTSTLARAFCAIGDLQGMGSTLTMNNALQNFTQVFWNYIDQLTSPITPSTSTVNYSVSASGDCYNLMMTGIYYQTTTCNTCTPSSGTLSSTAIGSASCSDTIGSVSVQVSGGITPYTYLWQPGNAATDTVNNLPIGTYTVTITDSTGCAFVIDSASVIKYTIPTAQFTLAPSPIAQFPGQICMTDQTIGSTQWQWTVNNSPVSTDTSYCYTLPDTGNYCVDLIATSAFGCSDTARSCVRADRIVVINETTVYIPNAFTPDASGLNNMFMPLGEGVSIDGYSFTIFNRWGILVYSTDVWGNGWDGTYNGRNCQEDVYVWKLMYKDVDNKSHNLMGHLTLIR